MAHTPLSRRTFLKGAVAGAVALGFDPIRRSWVSGAAAAEAADTLAMAPSFSGTLLVDEASLQAAADDFGHIIHRMPIAVLKPGSIYDVLAMVIFANHVGIKVAPRGQGHGSYGQMQVLGGVVIDMGTLDEIYAITPDYADVGAGRTWRSLIEATIPQGRTVPVLTDYIELSVGGTLAVGGIGGASHQHGVQIDNVLEIQVVTGDGKLEWCSMKHKRKLFEAVLAGLGQFAIVVRARVRLVEAKAMARVYTATYTDIATFTADQQMLIAERRFDYVEGQVVANGSGGWAFMIELAKYYNPSSPPSDAAMLAGLNYNAGTVATSDVTYFEFANRLEATINFLKSIGVWGFPHPWLNLMVPGDQVNSFVSNVLANLTLDDTGQGPVLIYPVPNNVFTRPLFQTAAGATSFLFAILRTAPPVQPVVDAMLASNRALYDANKAIGGSRYPVGAIPFTQADWAAHFGSDWEEFQKLKHKYDRKHVLTPGPGIF